MKAFVLNGIKSVEMKEIDVGKCDDDQVIIKNRMAAICGGDIYAYQYGGESNYIPTGSEFGHEMASEIVEIGKDVVDLKIGQRVYPYPITTKTNPRRSACLGGFSEYILVEKAKKDFNLFPLDDSITDKEAALIEPLTIGFKASKRTFAKPEQSALVFGAGTIGIASALYFKWIGMEKVMVIDRSKYRLDIIKNLGLATVNNLTPDWKKEVIDYFGESRGVHGPTPKAQIMVDAVGNAELFQDIQSLMSYFTTISIVGAHHHSVMVDMLALTYGHWTFTGSGGYTYEDVADVMSMIKSKKFDIESIISHVYKHEDFPEAIEKACKPEESLKVLIDYNL